MSTSQTPEFQFSQEALVAWDQVEARMWEKMRELVKQRASEQHRTMITQDDIKACLFEALEQAKKELDREDVHA